MNKYNLITTYGIIYNDIELVIKFDCKDKWIFKDSDGQYIVISSKDIDLLEPKGKQKVFNVIEAIDSEIERIKDTYVRMDGKYRLSDKDISYSDLLRADGALKELEELKRKIKED